MQQRLTDNAMNTTYLTGMLDYDCDVNGQLLEQLLGLSSVSGRTRDVFVHMLTAKQVWIKRLRGTDTSDIEIWPSIGLGECEQVIEDNRRAYRQFLGEISDAELNTTIRYKNSKGTEFKNSVQDVLMHVLIHGGYHRGQIARAVREAGGEPLVTDYVMYIREPTSE